MLIHRYASTPVNQFFIYFRFDFIDTIINEIKPTTIAFIVKRNITTLSTFKIFNNLYLIYNSNERIVLNVFICKINMKLKKSSFS